MTLTYTVDENNAVRIYSDEQSEPIIFQPDWPNSTPWADAQEAAAWAELCIASITDPAAPYAPSGPGLSPEPKPNIN
jgi:hypothetical protein